MRTTVLPTIALMLVVSALVHTQAPTYHYGELVRVQDVAAPEVLVVVGVPNDRIRADGSGVYVNDVLVMGFSPDFLTRALEMVASLRLDDVVPEGHYVVFGEQRVNQHISEHVCLHPGQALRR